MMKLFIACALFGAAMALSMRGFWWTSTGVACVAGSFWGCWINRPRILKNHDPNVPFTSQELRQIGIIPPENYDDWLDKYARR